MQFSPLPYHQQTCDHLKRFEPGLWNWFMSDRFEQTHRENSTLHLLKTTYRLARDSHPELYELGESVAKALDIDCPLTIYQDQSTGSETNAALYFSEDELIVVLQGPILQLLDSHEQRALFGHELSHHKLYTESNGEYFAAARLLHWCAEQPDCHSAYLETQRRYQLHTELYADLGAAIVCDAPDVPIASLLKVHTGLADVNVNDYLQQADEILQKDRSGAQGLTHPECFIRAKALSEGMADPQQYSTLVRGPLNVRRLDLLDQRELSQVTRDMALALGTDERFRQDEHEVLMREYFPMFEWRDETVDRQQALQLLRDKLADFAQDTQQYLAWALLDLTTADRDSATPLLGVALLFAEQIGIDEPFEATARKELKLKKADTAAALQQARDSQTGDSAP
jgi:hypothetical protein